MSFPNGSEAIPDIIIPQVFKDFISKSNGKAGLNFLKSLTKLLNLLGDGKVLKLLRSFFFGPKIITLIKKDGGLRKIAIAIMLRRITSKYAGSKSDNFFCFWGVFGLVVVINRELKLLHAPSEI